MNCLPSSIQQFPNLGGFIIEYTDNILYSCKNVGVVGWSLGPATCLMVPKNV